jgi:hypothetical protein
VLANQLCCHAGLGQRVHFDRLKRREFVVLLGAAGVWPLVDATVGRTVTWPMVLILVKLAVWISANI